jgi:hypothetical protein
MAFVLQIKPIRVDAHRDDWSNPLRWPSCDSRPATPMMAISQAERGAIS